MRLISIHKLAAVDSIEIETAKTYLVQKINPYTIYFFGSIVNGNMRRDSDIDIAFLSDVDIDDYSLFMMAQDLADICGREIDLIDLRKMSTVFKAQVVGTGKAIYCNDNLRRMCFEMYALKDYALLNEERAEILENIKDRGYVYDR